MVDMVQRYLPSVTPDRTKTRTLTHTHTTTHTHTHTQTRVHSLTRSHAHHVIVLLAFPPYNAPQLVRILKERLHGLDVVDDKVCLSVWHGRDADDACVLLLSSLVRHWNFLRRGSRIKAGTRAVHSTRAGNTLCSFCVSFFPSNARSFALQQSDTRFTSKNLW